MYRQNPDARRRHSTALSTPLESLERRVYCAVHALFLAGPGHLGVFGDILANDITVGRDAAGRILVNGGAVRVVGGNPTAANTHRITAFGFAGDDRITLDESNGPLPAATVFAGAGNDAVTGGSGADRLFGQSGNDVLSGNGAADLLVGGEGADDLTGGAGDDSAFGQSGNDRLVWNPGDGSDVNEGGDGADEILVIGGAAGEVFTAAPNGTRVRFERTGPAPFHIDIGTAETLSLRASAGDDTFTGAVGLAPLIRLKIDGGVGNDTLNGSDGADELAGGDGNDTIDGNGGADLALMGEGDDVFIWDPGDGSDTVEGQVGSDTMVFNGSNLAERMDVSANGDRVRFSRDLGNIVMDLNGLERVDVNSLGGADILTVNDLGATALAALNVNLAAAIGGATGDGGIDSVVLNGTAGDDNVQVAAFDSNRRIAVGGLSPFLNVTGAEGANDTLTVNTLGGTDFVDAGSLPAGLIGLTVVGGAGGDTMVGSAGNDTFVWDPGDGSDVVEGQGGADAMIFRGSNGGETFDLSANGNRLRLFRNPGAVTMDVNDVERVNVLALGGPDRVFVNDLAGTDVVGVDVNLGAGGTATGDLLADQVFVNGSGAADRIVVSEVAGAPVVIRPTYAVRVTGADGTFDSLAVNGLAGNDTVDASGLSAGRVLFSSNGGEGDDVLIGSAGDDVLVGGDGNDTLSGGPGADVLDGGPGSNVLTQD
ncbi:MAG TPA: calcium-binding protein [Tepidisphaeraceae bacterium]|nr:calcium-binding protein [Tepidisphaeraceae bacterium]